MCGVVSNRYIFLSQEAVENKLSEPLYPYASQRTGAGPMNSNLGA